MTSNGERISFKNKQEAKNLLIESRNRIDEIDNQLFKLISQRTSYAKNIALSKDYLGMPIYDEGREKEIHEKIDGLCEEFDLDVEIIDQIIDMLTILNKNEQNKILREEC